MSRHDSRRQTPPLPAKIRPNDTATGSGTIPVPRTVLALTLREQIRYPDGFAAGMTTLYEKEGAHSWPQNGG
jgi:hypothetical protein